MRQISFFSTWIQKKMDPLKNLKKLPGPKKNNETKSPTIVKAKTFSAKNPEKSQWKQKMPQQKLGKPVSARQNPQPLTSSLLPPTSYLLPPTSYLLPLTSHLLPFTSYLLPPTSYLLPPRNFTTHVKKMGNDPREKMGNFQVQSLETKHFPPT